MIMPPDGKVYVLEVNTLPGLMPSSILPDMCRYRGITYDDMVAALVKSAFRERPLELPKLYDVPPRPGTLTPQHLEGLATGTDGGVNEH